MAPHASSKSTTTTTLPKNWPPHIPYLTTKTYSPTLTPTQLIALRTRPSDASVIPPNTPRGPCPLVKITPIPISSTHPAAGQSGLFATRDLKPGTFIIQYLGEVHASSSTNPEADPHAESNYDLSLDRFHGLGIDADKRGNETRFINDHRGVPGRGVVVGGNGENAKVKANAEFREVWDEVRGERGMGVWVLGGGGKSGEAKNGKGNGNRKFGGIKKGEEILVSYGRGFWGARREEGDAEWEGAETWAEDL